LLVNLKNILIINAGGGFGDSVQFIPLLNWLYKKYPKISVYYYANDYKKYYFDNNLNSFSKPNLKVIKNFPLYFGFRIKHFYQSKKLAKKNFIKEFDLILDCQSKIRNTIIYNRIPHKNYFSSSANYFFCKPKYKNKKEINLIKKITSYLSSITNQEIHLEYNIEVNTKFKIKADQLISNKKKYIGLSLVAGHKIRSKEFGKDQIIQTINYFKRKNYHPVFFIEQKHSEMIDYIKKNVEDPFFPEHIVETEYQSPELLIAIANKMDFNLSIDNGVSHLLALSKSKTFCFYPGNAEKFKPQKQNFYTYNCDNYDGVQKLSSGEIIKFVNTNL
jgi:ADP-heptose:LPS heptosyltransferase